MKKSIRFIILVGVVVLVLGVGLAVILNMPAPTDTSNTKDSGDPILLYDKTGTDAEEITIKNSSGEFTFIGFSYEDQVSRTSAVSNTENSENVRVFSDVSGIKMYMHYTMQNFEDTELSKNMTDQLAYQCSYLTALKLIDNSGSKYAEYGLDDPVAVVKTVFGDNSENTLLIGNTAPDDQGIYCRLGENKNVYLVQLTDVNMFLIKKLQFFDRTLTAEYDSDNEDNSIIKLSLSGEFYDKPVEIDKEEDLTVSAEYKMRSPYREISAKNEVQSTGESVYGLTGSEIAAVQPTDEDKKQFGLDKPYIEINTQASDGTTVHILASKKNDDGSCYVMCDGGNIICKADSELIEKWYEKDYKTFLSGVVVAPNIKTMKKFTIQQGSKNSVYDIKTEMVINDLFEETLSIEITHGENKVRYENLSHFLSNISGLTRKTMDVDSRDGYDTVCTFTFEYESITDKLEICKNKDNKYIVILNDIIEGTVDGTYAEKLFAQIPIIDDTDKDIEIISN